MKGLMCLAQGHTAVTQVMLEPVIPRSRVKHSIVLQRSYDCVFVHLCVSTIQLDSANSDEIPIFATSRLSLQCMKCLDRKIKFLMSVHQVHSYIL